MCTGTIVFYQKKKFRAFIVLNLLLKMSTLVKTKCEHMFSLGLSQLLGEQPCHHRGNILFPGRVSFSPGLVQYPLCSQHLNTPPSHPPLPSSCLFICLSGTASLRPVSIFETRIEHFRPVRTRMWPIFWGGLRFSQA